MRLKLRPLFNFASNFINSDGWKYITPIKLDSGDDDVKLLLDVYHSSVLCWCGELEEAPTKNVYIGRTAYHHQDTSRHPNLFELTPEPVTGRLMMNDILNNEESLFQNKQRHS